METAGKRGRPSKVDAASIADAVLDIGIADATMRSVAARLEVSLPGLYHHVKGRDDLVRLAAIRAVETTPRPVFDGQSWDSWLREWAHFVRAAFSGQPELLGQYMTGAIEDEQMDIVSDALDVLVSLGISPAASFRIFAAVTNLALGDALYASREAALTRRRRPWTVRLFGFLAGADPEAHGALRNLGQAGTQPSTQMASDVQFDYLLAGIAQRHQLALLQPNHAQQAVQPASP